MAMNNAIKDGTMKRHHDAVTMVAYNQKERCSTGRLGGPSLAGSIAAPSENQASMIALFCAAPRSRDCN